MHRSYLPAADWTQTRFVLPREESRHLATVLRAKPGDGLQLLDGKGARADAVVLDIDDSGTVQVERTSEPQSLNPASTRIVLLQAVPKGKRVDWVLEKSVELGVSAICPMLTSRTIVRLDPAQRVDRRERWQRIVNGAAKQCGTPWIPEVLPIQTYGDALSGAAHLDLLLLGSLEPDARALHDVLRPHHARPPASVGLLIGPEGDFTPEEMRAARDHGATPVSFGAITLRTDTAALYGLSVLAYELLEAMPSGQ